MTLLPSIQTIVIMAVLIAIGQWARRISARAKLRRKNTSSEGAQVDLGKMEEVIREWVAFVQRSQVGPLEIRDTRELPRKKPEIALALYTVHHHGKDQELRDGALVFLDMLTQFQDDVGAPIVRPPDGPAEPGDADKKAARWRAFHGKVLEDRERLRTAFRTPPVSAAAGQHDPNSKLPKKDAPTEDRDASVALQESGGSGRRPTTSFDAKIPLAIGFANLSGEDVSGLVDEDVAVLSPLFTEVVVPAPLQIPRTPVLFVYAQFRENGTISTLEQTGIRQIVQATQAALVVVATPNPSDRVQKAALLPGPKTANLVFTLDRNGSHFGSFFKQLFERMRDGEDMPLAWVRIAPQGPVQRTDIPATLLLIEAGKLAFPR